MTTQFTSKDMEYALMKQRELSIAPELPKLGENGTLDTLLESYAARAQEVISEAENESGNSEVIQYLMNHVKDQIGLISAFGEREKQLQTRLVEANEAVKMDYLTKIPNRGAFDGKMERELERGYRSLRKTGSAQPLSLIMIDIDNFKKYNDTYGHTAGDEAIKAVANAIKTECRKVDMPARYGGEEMTVVCTETNQDEAYMLAERIRKSVEKVQLEYAPVTISLGVASTDYSEKITPKDLTDRADIALYQSKENGKNQTTNYQVEMVKPKKQNS